MKNILKSFITIITLLMLTGLAACTSVTNAVDSQNNLAWDKKAQLYSLTATNKISSNNVLLEQVSNQKVLFSQNSQQKVHIASLTKIMTTYILLQERRDLSLKVIMDPTVIADMKDAGASVSGFNANESITLSDLAYGIMLPSGGDAAVIAANYISGNEKSFVHLMNHYAHKLGMYRTHFTNATGLDTSDQYSTVADLCRLLNRALVDPTFKQIFTSLNHQTKPYDLSPGYDLNSTILAHQPNLTIKNGRLLGGKTGYTELAGLCLASLAKINGQEYLLITTGAPGNSTSKQYNIIDAMTIFNKIA